MNKFTPEATERIRKSFDNAKEKPLDILTELVVVNARDQIEKHSDSTALSEMFLVDQAIDTMVAIERLKLQLHKARKALALANSMILSGEEITPTAEEIFTDALK